MRIRPTTLAAVLVCTAVPGTAQPVIAEQGVTNAASYAIYVGGGGGIAPGSIAVIFGSGLGPATLQSAPAYPLGTELAGTSVRIGNASAYLVYSSATQVAAIVPSTVQPGTHPVTVTFNGSTSQPVPVPVAQTDFGIFTRNAGGYGQAAAQTVLAPNSELRTLGLATSIQPGEPVVLYGTGLGAIVGAPDDRPPGAARTVVPVQVVIGGALITPQYAGRSPNYAGLDQINFIAPADLSVGCYVPVAVRVNGMLSNIASIPVTQAGRTCPHPFNISQQAASRIDAGGDIIIAQVLGERRSSELGLVGEGIGIGFAQVDANSLEITVDADTDPYINVTLGTCALQLPGQNAPVIRRPRVSRPRFLDAGLAVRLTGPSFAGDLPRTPGSSYGMNLPNGTLREGIWTFSSTGGSDIGAFQLAAELPSALMWTNRQETLDPKQPLRIEWLNGGNSSVRVMLSAANTSNTNFASINCTSRPQDRSVTIPAALVSLLPSGGSGGITLTQEITKTGFNVPLRPGGTVDGSLSRIIYQASGPISVQ